MAASNNNSSQISTNIVISLCEEDIPGAKLPREIPEQCNVQQLKRWLSCRGACTSGRKPELIARVKDYVKSGLAAKHLRDPDGGIHLAKKKANLGVIQEIEPEVKTSFPAEGFSDSLDGLPFITFKAVWTYMVACLEAKRQLSTAKPLVKGFNFFKSGHVLAVKSCTKPDVMRTYIKSQVLPSMKKTSAYSCYIILRKNGLVHRAFCGCPAGVDGRCNHVAATLFSLEEFCKVRDKQEATKDSCTSQKCKWNVPRKRKGDVMSISNMEFKKHEYGKKKVKRNPSITPTQDVRAVHQRGTDNTKLYNILTKVRNFEEKTGKIIGLSHVLQKTTEEDIKVAINHDHCYSLPVPDKPRVRHEVEDSKNHDECISPIKVHPVPLSEIYSRCERIKEKLAVTEEQAQQIESETRKQSADDNWYKHRKYRITASKAYRCAALKESTSPTKAIQEVLGFRNVHATESMKAGLDQEPMILKHYIEERTKDGKADVTVQNCGFFVSRTHGCLGASPDGIVIENGEGADASGLIEMKYIQTMESETLNDALLRKRICVLENTSIKINCKHQYYFQIQQQMFVTQKSWTDFVVKGCMSDSIYIERVMFDSDFWHFKVFPKLESFFNNHILPEIAYPSIKYGKARFVLQYVARGI